MPKFKNSSHSAFNDFLNSNFRMPPIPEKYGKSGKVFIQFIVNKNGDIVNVTVHKSLHPHIICEINRITALAPKWQPGMNNGKPIDVPFTFPFEIKN